MIDVISTKHGLSFTQRRAPQLQYRTVQCQWMRFNLMRLIKLIEPPPALEKADPVRNVVRRCFPNINASLKLWSWTRARIQPSAVSVYYCGHCVSPSHLTAQIKAWIAVTALPLFYHFCGYCWHNYSYSLSHPHRRGEFTSLPIVRLKSKGKHPAGVW